MEFKEWLEKIYTMSNGKNLTVASVDKYVRAVETISQEMQEQECINKELKDMTLNELDVAIDMIFNNEAFLEKDIKGNRMYSCGIKRYRCYRHFITDMALEDICYEESAKMEKDAIVKIRIGQQKFKKELLKKYSTKCPLTGISLEAVLVASHIKPWAVSNDTEKIDVNNGILLSSLMDKLFDAGLITFKENGAIVMSNLIDNYNISKIGLKPGEKYDIKVTEEMKKYLKYHNDMICVK